MDSLLLPPDDGAWVISSLALVLQQSLGIGLGL